MNLNEMHSIDGNQIYFYSSYEKYNNVMTLSLKSIYVLKSGSRKHL